MSMTVAIIVVWALVMILPFAVAVPMMFRARTALRISDGRFLLAFSGLLAAVAAANGVVEQSEIEAVEGFLSKMGLTPAEKALCYGNFILASREKQDAHAYARELVEQFGRTGCTFLYSLVWRMARSDGGVDPAEELLLREIAADFGFENDAYAWFKADKTPALDRGELRKAGVPPSLIRLVK